MYFISIATLDGTGSSLCAGILDIETKEMELKFLNASKLTGIAKFNSIYEELKNLLDPIYDKIINIVFVSKGNVVGDINPAIVTYMINKQKEDIKNHPNIYFVKRSTVLGFGCIRKSSIQALKIRAYKDFGVKLDSFDLFAFW